MDKHSKDARFARVHSDPRFHRPRREDTKVALDDRFKDVLSTKGTKQLDRFGRKGHVSEAKELQRMYRLDEPGKDYARGEVELESSSEEDDDDDDDKEDEEDEDEEDEDEDEDEDERGDVVVGSTDAVRRAARHEDAYESDASIDLNEDDLDESVMAELDKQAKKAQRRQPSRDQDVARGDDTSRLAVVNMDWDHVRALDLFKVFASVVSPQATREPLEPVAAPAVTKQAAHMALAPVRGQVRSVRIYLSDFGRERLAREDVQGPPREIFQSRGSGHRVQESEAQAVTVDEGEDFNEDALRKYQLERLRYYYAVATFDNAKSARHVYNEIDGTEMERSANMFDLRFVPDDMVLPDGEEGRPAEFQDEATEDVAHYEGLDFKTDALRHSKVRLTWDQDDPRRTKLTRTSQKGQLHEDDLKTYLASSDEDEDVDHTSSRNRLRSLLTDMPSKSAFDDADDQDTMFTKPEGDMEISFAPALASSKKEAEDDHEETTIEKYMRKQREKRERRRAKAQAAQSESNAEPKRKPEQEPELELEDEPGEQTKDAPVVSAFEDTAKSPVAGDDDVDDHDDGDSDDQQHFQLQDIVRAEKMQSKKMSKHQRKREAKRASKRQPLVQPSFVMDTQDPRFAAVMHDHRFAIDPSHPGFIKTAGMQQLIDEGNRRRAKASSHTDTQPDVASLVSSIKQKAAAAPPAAKKPRRTR